MVKTSSKNEQRRPLTVERPPTNSPGVPRWKRGLDLVCILLTVPGWLPLGLFIAAVIKLVSPGPVFFRQDRIGLSGRRFSILKFRTMRVNADTAVHEDHFAQLITSNAPMTKLDATGDPRLIRFGRLLRATGLDELPQILNVLRGEMSLVGPRPCLPYEYENYSARHRRRCETLPGLTGLWQTNGKNQTTFEEMISLDVEYALTKSFLLDLKIMARTFPALLEQHQASRRQRNSRVPTIMRAIASRPVATRSK